MPKGDEMKRLYSLRRGAFSPTMLEYRRKVLGRVSDFFFDPPRADVVGIQGKFQRTGECRQPRREVSSAMFGEEREVSDSGERKMHTLLRSGTFGLHPEFGTGHVLETNGDVAAFWNGESVYLVRLENVEMVGVVLDAGEAMFSGAKCKETSTRPKGPTKVQKALNHLNDLLNNL